MRSRQPLAVGSQLLQFIAVADVFRQSLCVLARDGQPLVDVKPLNFTTEPLEAIVGKSMPDEGIDKCLGFVQTYDAKPNRACLSF